MKQEEAFVKAVKGEKTDLFPTIKMGAQGQLVVDAIIRSAEEERWIRV